MAQQSHYCEASVGHNTEPKSILGSFDEVVAYLKTSRNALVDKYVEQVREPDPNPLGGFGIWLRNRWNSELEVGVGLGIWLFIRLKPKPTAIYSDAPKVTGRLVFYLDGGHYTDFDAADLVTKEAAIRALRDWLESNNFPADNKQQVDGEEF